MSKPFKTIDEQIELLRYRGMTIADEGYRRKRGALDGVSWV
ncbi:MAG: hypothetical protein ACLRG2_09960 [Pauljensenia sp.]